MEQFWNRKDLVSPPVNTSKVEACASDIKKLHNYVSKTTEMFEINKYINKEAALLSRIIYRMKYKFRSDKAFKTMEKVNRALLQFLNMNFEQDLETFKNSIDANQIDEFNFRTVYLPTRQMFEYLLVRCQGFGKLMVRIINSCEIAANYMKERISTGQSWPLALLTISVFSRIRAIALYLVQKNCCFYNNIIQYLNILQPLGVKWLPDGYTFPIELFSWLEIKPEDLTIPTNVKEVNESSNVESMDLGIEISRDQFTSFKLQEKQTVKASDSSPKHSINNVTDVVTLQKFMIKEDKYRKQGSEKSVSKHLDLDQWKLLQKLVGKLIKKMTIDNDKRLTKKLIVKTKKIFSNNINV